MGKTYESIKKIANEHGVQMVDLKFQDFPGQWQHFSMPVSMMDEALFEDGAGFDGSSIRGWQGINESDMLVIPDPDTAFIDPFMNPKTLSLICDVVNPLTKEKYSRCPRNITQKAEDYLKSTGIADTAFFGPAAEFFIFDNVQFELTQNSGFYFVDSKEGRWNSGADEAPNLGHKPPYKGGYFPVPPLDALNDIRAEMVMVMQECGLNV